VDFDKVISEGEVLVVKGALGAMGAGNTSVLMQLLVGMLDAALARSQDGVSAEKRTAVALKVDEAPLVLGRGFAETMALKRSAGLETVACWQTDAQWIDRDVRAQLDALFAHRVYFATASVQDARASASLMMSEFSDTVRPGIRNLSDLGRPDVRLHLPKHSAIASWVTPEGRQAPFVARTLPLCVDEQRLAFHAARQAERGGRFRDDLSQPHWERRAQAGDRAPESTPARVQQAPADELATRDRANVGRLSGAGLGAASEAALDEVESSDNALVESGARSARMEIEKMAPPDNTTDEVVAPSGPQRSPSSMSPHAQRLPSASSSGAQRSPSIASRRVPPSPSAGSSRAHRSLSSSSRRVEHPPPATPSRMQSSLSVALPRVPPSPSVTPLRAQPSPPTTAADSPSSTPAASYRELVDLDAAHSVRRAKPAASLLTLDPDPLDIEILGLIVSMRHVLSSQIHRRFNEGRAVTTTQRRLKRLSDAGLVARFQFHRRDGGGAPMCYSITPAGLHLSGECGRSGAQEILTGGLTHENDPSPSKSRTPDQLLRQARHDVRVAGWVLAVQRIFSSNPLEFYGPRESVILPPSRSKHGDRTMLGLTDLCLPGGRAPHDFLRTIDSVARIEVDRFQSVRPDATIRAKDAELLVELDDRLPEGLGAAKLERYDHFLAGWSVHHPRYSRPAAKLPIVVFVCRDRVRARECARRADRVLTACRAYAGEYPSDWDYPGRERIVYVAERDAHEGHMGALGVAALPPDVRVAAADGDPRGRDPILLRRDVQIDKPFSNL
jgi:hypothetical protein